MYDNGFLLIQPHFHALWVHRVPPAMKIQGVLPLPLHNMHFTELCTCTLTHEVIALHLLRIQVLHRQTAPDLQEKGLSHIHTLVTQHFIR